MGVRGLSGGAGWGRGARIGAGLAALMLAPAGSLADTLEWALVQAYQNNPSLNAQRAAVRVTDEAVPIALSGYRPRLSLSASVTEQYLDSLTKSTTGGVAT